MDSKCGLVLVAGLLLAGCGDDDGNGDVGSLDSHDVPDGGCATTEPYCSADRLQLLACDPATGLPHAVETCDPGEACVGGACVVTVCTPGETECLDEHSVNVCLPDGSAWNMTDCPPDRRCNPETDQCEVPCRLRMFVLVDKSGSMGGTTSPTKWDQARTAVATLMGSEAAASVEFGFGVFPSGSDSCGLEEQVLHPIPEATAVLVDDYFEFHAPNGSTPLLEAVRYHIADTSANLNDPAYHNFLVVVSDGADTCYSNYCETECGPFAPACLLECQERATAEVVTYLGETGAFLRDNLAIRTFVIGFGGDVSGDELQALAENGGTALGTWLSAADVTELTAALEQILAEMQECNDIIL